MDVIEAVKSRRSYRGKYKADRVPREDLVTIINAGLAAPSGCNKQTTSLIAVDDPGVLGKLHEMIDPPVEGDSSCRDLRSYQAHRSIP